MVKSSKQSILNHNVCTHSGGGERELIIMFGALVDGGKLSTYIRHLPSHSPPQSQPKRSFPLLYILVHTLHMCIALSLTGTQNNTQTPPSIPTIREATTRPEAHLTQTPSPPMDRPRLHQ